MSLFERHPKCTILIVMALFMVIGIALLEFSCRLIGLGEVVVYEASPVYGYRPIGPQTVKRLKGKMLSFNELGLRVTDKWAQQPHNRILFLGDSITYGGSYIDNSELFSTLVEQSLPGWAAGNAGVNGWGVMNVHGLVEIDQFQPAQIYVSTFPEEDFERGLVRLIGSPFWSSRPSYAFEELFQYWVYKVSQRKWNRPMKPTSDLEITRTREASVLALKSYDQAIKASGAQHVIYITPMKVQLQGIASRNEELLNLFEAHGLSVKYLEDSLQDIPKLEVPALYHDMGHLSEAGHIAWAKVISSDLNHLIASHALNEDSAE